MALLATQSLLIVNAQQDHPDAEVVILPSAGGTSNPTPGTYKYDNFTEVTVTTTANSGFEFLYWNITASPMEDQSHQSDMNRKPFPGISELGSLILTDSSSTITVDCDYIYTYQAVFGPIDTTGNNSVNTDIATNTQESGLPITLIAGAVVAAIIAAVVVALVLAKRKGAPKKVDSV